MVIDPAKFVSSTGQTEETQNADKALSTQAIPDFSHLNIPEPSQQDLKWSTNIAKLLRTPKKYGSVRRKLVTAILKRQSRRVHDFIEQWQAHPNKDDILSEEMSFAFVDSRSRLISYCLYYNSRSIVAEMFSHFLKPVSRDSSRFMDSDYQSNVSKLPSVVLKRWYLEGLKDFSKQTLDKLGQDGAIQDVIELKAAGLNLNDYNGILISSAAKHQNIDFIKTLLDMGVNPFVNKGQAPNIAEEYGKIDVANLIRAEMKKQRQIASKSGTIIHGDNIADNNWSIVSPTAIEYIEPAGSSDINIIHKINFDTEMVTVIAKRDGQISATAPQRFDQQQSRSLIEKAHLKMTEIGHTLPSLDTIFNTQSQKTDVIGILPKTSQKTAPKAPAKSQSRGHS